MVSATLCKAVQRTVATITDVVLLADLLPPRVLSRKIYMFVSL